MAQLNTEFVLCQGVRRVDAHLGRDEMAFESQLTVTLSVASRLQGWIS